MLIGLHRHAAAHQVSGRFMKISVHNHPSGDPTPSRADIDMTKQVVEAAKAMDIVVHDHIIVGHGRHASMKALGLIS